MPANLKYHKIYCSHLENILDDIYQAIPPHLCVDGGVRLGSNVVSTRQGRQTIGKYGERLFQCLMGP